MQFITSTCAILAALTATVAALPAPAPTAEASTTATSAGHSYATTTLTGTPTGKMHHLPPLPSGGFAPGIHRYTHDAFGQPNITRISDIDFTPHAEDSDGDMKVKRVTTWTGCENYGFTSSQSADITNAWNGLYNWAATAGSGGYSPWIDGHYFAWTSSGTFAYICEWGNGNHASTNEINTAHGVVTNTCAGPGMFQWNDWKKGLGVAAYGQNWCNGQSFV